MSLLLNEDQSRILLLDDAAKTKPCAYRDGTDDLLGNVAEINNNQTEPTALQKHVSDFEGLLKRS